MTRWVVIAACMAGIGGVPPGSAGFAQAAERIQGLEIGNQAGKTHIYLDLSGTLPYSIFTLADPYRIVIDLPEVEWSAKSRSANSNIGLVSGYRFGLFQPGNSRFVLDLAQPARIIRNYYAEPGASQSKHAPQTRRLVIEVDVTGRESFLKTAGFKGRLSPAPAPVAALPNGKQSPAVAPAPAPPKPPEAQSGARQALLMPPPKPGHNRPPAPAAPEPAVVPQKPLSPSGIKAAKQRIIVIDAGHGGVDPGAMTAQGMYEKTIVLDTARRLKNLLSRDKRYKVVMTRDSDIFVRLGDRVQLARTAQADLLVSIHADSLATRKIRGASVYTLSEQASDKEAELLAAKENNSDMIAGIGLGDETDELVKTILIDLAQRETTNKSVHFAKLLLPQLRDSGALLKNSHRYAGFRVLKAPDVPSVLVELGLLSNTTDARVLTSQDGRQKLAEAIKRAIENYFRDMKS
ncbi:MAG: N-acetylmuramoyl-L-alanine amidase [Alphaproteobacteria bacterium]|nr:N-acetylmuramoyl-L-alanine amidase [Alphaproteobacteria bacterium]